MQPEHSASDWPQFLTEDTHTGDIVDDIRSLRRRCTTEWGARTTTHATSNALVRTPMTTDDHTPNAQDSSIAIFPDELLEQILHQLICAEVPNAAATCSAWYCVIHRESFWHYLYTRDMLTSEFGENSSSTTLPAPPSGWRLAYKFCKQQRAPGFLMRQKHPDRIPVQLTQQPGDRLPKLPANKKMFLVPADLSVGQFNYVIRRRLSIEPTQALFLSLVDGDQSMAMMMTMRELDNRHADADGLLHMVYSGILVSPLTLSSAATAVGSAAKAACQTFVSLAIEKLAPLRFQD